MQRTILMISFVDAEVVTLQRSVSLTYTEFLSICGGLLGLFLGVSVLSIIEFAYFSTLRLYWTIRRSNSENAVVPFAQTAITIGQNERSSQNSNRIVSKNARLRLKSKPDPSLPLFIRRQRQTNSLSIFSINNRFYY